MLTDVDQLPLPEWLGQEVLSGSRADVLQQGGAVGRAWWERRLSTHDLVADLFPGDGRLNRADIFELGEASPLSSEAARRLLWAACAWGTGNSQRGNGRRVRGVGRDPEALGQVLQRAAALAIKDPQAAYATLGDGRNRVPGLGPAFFTKFLYFAGGGAPDHPCLILDARVARRLRGDCGWTSLTGTTGWPAATYGRYWRLLARWSVELSTTERAVCPDELEYRLFQGPASKAPAR